MTAPAGVSVRPLAAPASGTKGPSTTPHRASTPASVQRLRRLQLSAVALLLVFGALVVTALAVSYNSARAGRETLTQYNRLADAQVQARAVQQTAHTWPLAPSSTLRASVGAQLADLATTLADASSVAEDRDRVVPLTGALVSYGMILQDALNADGTASATLLAKADSQLTSDLVRPLDEGKQVVGDRLVTELNSGWILWVYLGAGVAVAGIGTILVLLARSSHRYLNLGVAAGLICALISVGIAAVVLGVVANTADGFSSTTRPTLDNLATTRQQLNQARADELLSVGLRTAGSTYQTRWTTGYDAARKALAPVKFSTTARSYLSSYATAHAQVTAALGRSQWDQAAGLAVDAGASGKAFTSADQAIEEVALNVRAPLAAGVAQAADVIGFAIASVIVLTLAAASLATWGVARRIEEYR